MSDEPFLAFEDLERDRQVVVQAIRSAFEDVLLGDGMTLREGRVHDDRGSEDALVEARANSPELRQHWTTMDAFATHHDAIWFLDPAGWRFYLPAYLTLALSDVDMPLDFTDCYWERVIDVLDPRRGKSDAFDALSATQVAAVCLFLRFMAFHAHPQVQEQCERYLEGHWYAAGSETT